MTYTTGGTVQAVDYNGFVSTNSANINGIWNTLYGQTALTTVAAGGSVTATQWATLNTTISSMAAHQGTTITSRTNPVVGNIISVLANVSSDITSCQTNQYNAASVGTQYVTFSGSVSKTTATGSGTNPWSIAFTDTITFANATAASSFFNSGGYVKIQFSKSSTGTAYDGEWNNFVTAVCGTLYFTSTGAAKTINGTSYTGTTLVGGTGTPTTLLTSTGFAQLTSTPVVIYQQNGTGAPYTSNYVQVAASVSSGVLTFTTTWYESGGGGVTGASISGGTATNSPFSTFGTAPTTLVTYFPPETTNITNTWGTPTISSSII